tara:strand:- start:840 stop:1667 length:828 start_codon:yes stop_codon:yes gene_type:complete
MRCAVIGLGVMGKNHYKILQDMPAISSVVTVDSQEPATYTSVSDMLVAEDDIDFAVVATPTISHKDVAIELIKNKIHVLIEKPISNDIENSKKILYLSTLNNVKVAVGHIERFNPAIQNLLKQIEGQQVINCNIIRIGPYPSRIKDVGVKLDLSVHDMDLLSFLTKEKIIDSYCISSNIKGVNEDTVNFLCKMSNGCTGTIFNSWLSPHKKRNIEILTTEQYYNVDLMSHNLKGNALQLELEEFIKYIQTGNIGFLCSPSEAINTLINILWTQIT